jgi:predicted DNA-binding transcriptional regulator YafY
MPTADRQEIVTSFAIAMTVLDLLLAPHRSGARLDEILDELVQHDTAREAQAVRRRYLRILKTLGWHLQTTEPLQKIQVSRHQKQTLHLLHFSQAELEALYFHLHLAPSMLGDGTWSHHFQMVLRKVGLYLGEALYEQQALCTMFTPWQKGDKAYGTGETQHRLLALLHAIGASIVCRVTYRTPQAHHATTYEIQPYALCTYDGGLYLFAYRPDITALTVLAVERLIHLAFVTPTSNPEEPPQPRAQYTRFVPQAAVFQELEVRRQHAFGMIDDGEVLEVTLRFTSAQAPYVAERTWHATQQIEPQPDGTLLLRFQASGRFEIVRWILQWGAAVEVLAPTDLRAQVAQQAQRAAARYADQ